MNTKKTMQKIFFISVWLVIGSGMVILLAAAMRKQKNSRCKDYSITINNGQDNLFINKKDVEQLLMTATKGTIKGQPLSGFNLHQLEQLLEQNKWISDAGLYFDNRDVLHVSITERQPVARIFTVAGNSYYIDSSAKKMPLSDKVSARVPVFTGFPDKKVLSARDSVLLNEVKTMARFIISDSFWMAQVSQINITDGNDFEMIPVVGNHLVKLGNGEDIQSKFHRLFVFYKNVLSQTGFNKYKTIDVQYKGQVIGVKGEGNPKIDSVLLRKSVEKLLQQARDAEYDTVVLAPPVFANKSMLQTDEDASAMKDDNGVSNNSSQKPTSPNPLKSPIVSHPNETTGKPKLTTDKPARNKPNAGKPKLIKPNKEPKAVMPKKDDILKEY